MDKNRHIIDRELAVKCRNGDRDAFSELVHFYKRPLYAYLFRLCNCRMTADDLLQETLIKTWQSMTRYREKNKFATWLFCIAYNTAVDHLRGKKRLEKAKDRFSRHVSRPPSPLEQVMRQESKLALYSAVQSLSEKQRHVFLLRMHGGMTFKDIARLTGEPLNTVLSHMHYAVKKLKKMLEH